MAHFLREAWDYDPPKIKFLAEPLPNTPYMALGGSGTSRRSIDDFEKELKKCVETKQGSYYQVRIWECEQDDEIDHYTLAGWEVHRDSQCYEAVVILYYQAIHPYEVILRYMPDLAEDYRNAHPMEFVDVDALEAQFA